MSLHGIQFDSAVVARLFPFYFAFDRDCRIISMGPSLEKLSLLAGMGSDWRDVFALTHPSSITPLFDDICQSLGSLFVLHAASENLD